MIIHENPYNMKKILLSVIFLIVAISGSSAQILKPITWQFGSKKINADEAVIFMKASIQNGWHIYSQHLKEGGPIKTSFAFTPSNDYTLVGSTAEPKPKTKYEDVFDMDVTYFDQEVVFQQRIKLNKGAATVKGVVEFMACDARRCLPPDEVEFTVAVK